MLSKSEQKSKLSWSVEDFLDDFKSDSESKATTPTTGPSVPMGYEDLFAQLEAVSQQGPPPEKATIASRLSQFSLTAPFKPSREFAIGAGRSGLWPLGCPSVLGAIGGGLKTATAISCACHMAAGQSWNGEPVRESAVLFLSMEDDQDEMTRKVYGTVKTQIDPSRHHLVEKRFHIAALPGVDCRLTKVVRGSSERTKRVDEIVEIAESLTESSDVPVGLIVLDHIRLLIGGDLNDSGHATELTRALTYIGQKTGAAVLALSHSPKSTVNPNHSGVYSMADLLGSGAVHDNARQAMLLTPLTDAERKKYVISPEAAKQYAALRVIKSNYSESDRVIYLRKVPVEGLSMIVPQVVTLSSPIREYVAPTTGADKVLAYLKLADNVGRFTKSKFKTVTGRDGPLGIGTAAAVAALDALIEAGKVVLRSPTADEVAKFELGRQAREVLHAVE